MAGDIVAEKVTEDIVTERGLVGLAEDVVAERSGWSLKGTGWRYNGCKRSGRKRSS